MKDFNDVEYFSDVAKIRLVIAKLMKKHHLVDEVVMENALNQVDPFYGRIAKTGAFAVEFYCGLPEYIYTPYGKTAIDAGAHHSLDAESKANLFNDLETLFGLKVAKPAFMIDGVDKFGPWCTLTKLPWKANEKFPATFVNATEVEDAMHFASHEEAMHVQDVFAQVNQNLKTQMQATQQDVVAEPVVTPHKKRYFVLSAQLREQQLTGTQKEC